MQGKTEKSKRLEWTLVVSALFIVLCGGALFGTAHAWLEDRVSQNVAAIQAGTLEVDLVDAEGKSFIIKDGSAQAESIVPLVFTKVVLTGDEQAAEDSGQVATETGITVWNIGEAYQLPTMYVVNRGTTDLMYTVSIGGISGIEISENTTVNLTDLIDFTIRINEEETLGTSASGDLRISDDLDTAETDESKPDTVVISGKLKEGVDLSSYRGMQFSGITIRIEATQNVR